jgi:hypothetical protein
MTPCDGGPVGVEAQRTQMGQLPDRHRGQPVFARPLDREVGGADPDDLPEPEPPVEQHGRPVVGDHRHLGHRLDVPGANPVHVERHQVGSVRVHAAEVRLHQRPRHQIGVGLGHAERDQELGAVRLKVVGGDERVSHGEDSPRPHATVGNSRGAGRDERRYSTDAVSDPQ